MLLRKPKGAQVSATIRAVIFILPSSIVYSYFIMHASQKSVFTPDWISVQVCVQRQSFSLETIPVCWNLLPHVVKQTRLSEWRAKGGGEEGNWTGNLAREIEELSVFL